VDRNFKHPNGWQQLRSSNYTSFALEILPSRKPRDKGAGLALITPIIFAASGDRLRLRGGNTRVRVTTVFPAIADTFGSC
jgi:hypothetical protein